MKKQLVRISKFLSLVLRHKPETIGLALDPEGWAEVDELLVKAQRAGVSLNKDLIQLERSHTQRIVRSATQDRRQ